MHQLFHSTQTWTFPGRFETVTKSNQKSGIPGPAHYSSTKVTTRAPTFGIGTQRRSDPFRSINDTPGPGAHNLKSYIDVHAVVMQDGPKRSMSARHDLRQKITPGPTDYDNDMLRTKKKEPQFSMSARSKDFQQIVRDNNLYKPSPNMYNSFKGSFSNPKGVIGTSRRRDLTETEKTPGPGAYLTIDQLERSKLTSSFAHPRCSIGSNFRNTDISHIRNSNPGPGAYQKNSLWEDNEAKKRGYTMRPKTADLLASSRSKLPGPGHYDDSQFRNTQRRFPGYTCGTDKRQTFIDEANRSLSPGPGNHDPNIERLYRSASSHKFGLANRKDLYENQKTPGPNYYDADGTKLLNKAPGFSPTKDRRNLNDFILSRDTVPGPQSYDPHLNLVKQSSTMSQIPHEQRPNFDKAKFSPGPGYYNLRGKASGPTWKFTTERRSGLVSGKEGGRIPGAPDYEIPGMIPNPPKYMTASNYKSKMLSISSSGLRTTR